MAAGGTPRRRAPDRRRPRAAARGARGPRRGARSPRVGAAVALDAGEGGKQLLAQLAAPARAARRGAQAGVELVEARRLDHHGRAVAAGFVGGPGDAAAARLVRGDYGPPAAELRERRRLEARDARERDAERERQSLRRRDAAAQARVAARPRVDRDRRQLVARDACLAQRRVDAAEQLARVVRLHGPAPLDQQLVAVEQRDGGLERGAVDAQFDAPHQPRPPRPSRMRW